MQPYTWPEQETISHARSQPCKRVLGRSEKAHVPSFIDRRCGPREHRKTVHSVYIIPLLNTPSYKHVHTWYT